MTPRMSRHFQIACMPTTSDDALKTIFESILTGFLSIKFKQDVQVMGSGVVSAAIDIYKKCGEELLPTPTRSHYTFNLRDVSKVFQGVLMIRPMQASTPEKFIRLWLHEVQRVFEDRLIDLGDKQWLRNALQDILRSKFRLDWPMAEWESVLFCNFLKPGAEEKLYEEALDVTKVLNLITENNSTLS